MLFLGGSQMRGLYKDMVWLLNHPSTIPNEVLGAKSENRFPDMEKTEWKVQQILKELLSTKLLSILKINKVI